MPDVAGLRRRARWCDLMKADRKPRSITWLILGHVLIEALALETLKGFGKWYLLARRLAFLADSFFRALRASRRVPFGPSMQLRNLAPFP